MDPPLAFCQQPRVTGAAQGAALSFSASMSNSTAWPTLAPSLSLSTPAGVLSRSRRRTTSAPGNSLAHKPQPQATPSTLCDARHSLQPGSCIRSSSTAISRHSSASSTRHSSSSRRRSSSSRSSSASVAPAFTGDGPNTEQGEAEFLKAAEGGNLVPICRRIFSDHLTPVLAYRCLVKEDEREAPSFLFESVENGGEGASRSARYSFVGAQPALEVVAKGGDVSVVDHGRGTRERRRVDDPMGVAEDLSAGWKPVLTPDLPASFCGGWVGYTSYDTVRYVESKKLPFSSAPEDDRNLPDIHLGLYNDVVVFDHVTKVVYIVCWVHLAQYHSASDAFWAGLSRLNALAAKLQPNIAPLLPAGAVSLNTSQHSTLSPASNMSREGYEGAVAAAKEYILAGDIFQIVLSQRFERRTFADPFEVYRALRVVNPSPYLVYLQARGSILVASSPEILCRMNGKTVVNRPLAGTRRRGGTPEEDLALERELLADEKELAEHVMLVDLGRNDVGKVSVAGSVKVQKLMEVERYSHVMHISSTVTGELLPEFSAWDALRAALPVTGELLPELSAWDALRAALPVGTVSGAPKVRAMQLIDQLEPTRRGPYSGGIGYASFSGNLDFALALRTMVFPTSSAARHDTLYRSFPKGRRQEWIAHLQAGAGIVADSDPKMEYEETVNKAAALGRAIELAEAAFLGLDGSES